MSAIRLERIPAAKSPAQVDALQRVFASVPDYCDRVIGHTPGLDEVRDTALPPGKYEDDHYLFGVFLDAEMIGCADLLRGYPEEKTAMLGLLLLSEAHQHRGLGSETYDALETVARSWPQISVMRIAIVATNDIVIPFWRRLGFFDTRIRAPYRSDQIVSETIVMEKRLV